MKENKQPIKNTKKSSLASKNKKTEKVEDVKTAEIREVIVEKQVGFNTLEVIIIMIIAVLFGALIGSVVTYSKGIRTEKSDLEEISSDLTEFVDTYNNILDNYYKKVDKDELLNAGIKGMMEYLNDSHSVYMDVEETSSFNEKVEGNYVGIGTEVSLVNDVISISSIFPDSPASKAGLEVGDIIKAVDNNDITGVTLTDVSALIKGAKGTTVKLTILRNEMLKDIVVIRDTVELTSVTSKLFETNNKKIGYLKIDVFAANTKEQFEKELESLEAKKIDSLILDVRDNPGGHLTQVSEMLSLFIEKGKILYQIETKGIKEPTYDWSKEKRTYPIVVLINHASASASEILASSLNESYGSKIVGVTSYGKGTVQKAYELKSGATIKYTTQRWLTPKGVCIDGIGVTPTVEIQLDKVYYENPIEENDNQLQKAIELLK